MGFGRSFTQQQKCKPDEMGLKEQVFETIPLSSLFKLKKHEFVKQ